MRDVPEDAAQIVTEGKALGAHLYMMTGGEPMVRKKDVLRLCEKHNDCFFAAYTNSTLIDEQLSKYGFTVGNPREDARRGGHVCLEHADAIRINEALKAADVVPDFRYPNVIRLAPVALYTRYEDVYELVRRLAEIMETKAYLSYSDKIGPVA